MISDVLADAIAQIQQYLVDPAYAGTYGKEGDEVYGMIASAIDEMEHCRCVLDTAPDATPRLWEVRWLSDYVPPMRLERIDVIAPTATDAIEIAMKLKNGAGFIAQIRKKYR